MQQWQHVQVGVSSSGRRRRALLATALLVGALTVPLAAAAPPTPVPAAALPTKGFQAASEERMCQGRLEPSSESPPHETSRMDHRDWTHGGDLALDGNRMVALCGNDDSDLYNDGFVVADISDRTRPKLLGRFLCVASASDLAVYGDLVFLAVDRNFDTGFSGPYPNNLLKGEADPVYGCEDPIRSYYVPSSPPTGAPSPPPAPATPALLGHDPAKIFRGIRIVDISDPSSPRLVASVMTNLAGAHTVTAVPERKERGAVSAVHVYTSAPGERLQRVVRVPLEAPEEAVLSKNQRDLDTEKDASNGTGCHDISFFLPHERMVCDRLEPGSVVYDRPVELFSKKDAADKHRFPPYELTLRAVLLPQEPTARNHSSAFSYDGQVLAVSNEASAAAASNSCAPVLGAVSFYDVSGVPAATSDKTATAALPLRPVGFQSAPVVANSNWCTSANFNVVPTRDGSRLAVLSWYAGGTTVVDFTNPARPEQLAHYVRDVGHAERASTTRSSYWYDGHVYVGNTHGCITPKGDHAVEEERTGSHPQAPTCLGGTERGLEVLTPASGQGEPLDGLSRAKTFPLDSVDFGRQECFYTAGKTSKAGTFTCP